MALDAATYGRVEEAEKLLGDKIDGLNGTVEGLPEEVQNQLDAFKATIDELKKNVEDTLADVQETVENSPAGVMPPGLNSFSSQSVESGIQITFQVIDVMATDGPRNDSVNNSLALTKGVMFRYSTENFPMTKDEGTLCYDTQDIYETNALGNRNRKTVSHVITGLTTNTLYYISAFPYSSNNVFNETGGYSAYGSNYAANRTKCQWTGTKGTLTVNVTQDYDYKPLGEYTATLTPTAGGQAITKTQSGAATIVFSGLEAGQYTLSFSGVASFTKPSNQSVTVTAGQSQTISAQYHLNVNLSSLSWVEIDEYGKMGVADKIFSVGDTKDVIIDDETLTFRIAGFNHDDLADGSGKAPFTFEMKHMTDNKRRINTSNTNSGSYESSELNDILNTTFYNGMPEELKSVIKTVKKITGVGGRSTNETRVDNFKIWLFSENEVFGTKTLSVGNEGTKYPIFTSNTMRIKKLANGTGATDTWWLRSPAYDTSEFFCVVYSNSVVGSVVAGDPNGISFGFCV